MASPERSPAEVVEATREFPRPVPAPSASESALSPETDRIRRVLAKHREIVHLDPVAFRRSVGHLAVELSDNAAREPMLKLFATYSPQNGAVVALTLLDGEALARILGDAVAQARAVHAQRRESAELSVREEDAAKVQVAKDAKRKAGVGQHLAPNSLVWKGDALPASLNPARVKVGAYYIDAKRSTAYAGKPQRVRLIQVAELAEPPAPGDPFGYAIAAPIDGGRSRRQYLTAIRLDVFEPASDVLPSLAPEVLTRLKRDLHVKPVSEAIARVIALQLDLAELPNPAAGLRRSARREALKSVIVDGGRGTVRP